MSRSRIEVSENGDFILTIPEDVVQELVLEEGDSVEWSLEDGYVELYFG